MSDPASAPYFPSGTGTNTPQKTPPRTEGTDGADVGGRVANKERRASRARLSYRVIELTRVIAYAILLGAFGSSQHSLGQVLAVLAVSVVQVFLLILIRVSQLTLLLATLSRQDIGSDLNSSDCKKLSNLASAIEKTFNAVVASLKPHFLLLFAASL